MAAPFRVNQVPVEGQITRLICARHAMPTSVAE
jgi:hypothetical protein